MGRTFGVVLVSALAAAGLAVAGCGGGGAGGTTAGGTTAPAGGTVTVQLAEQNGSGEAGTATLTSEGAASTKVVLELSNPPADPQPAHIHEGTCAKLNPTPKYALSNVVNGKSETTVAVGLTALQQADYAINVHKSAAEAAVYFSCGDIPKS